MKTSKKHKARTKARRAVPPPPLDMILSDWTEEQVAAVYDLCSCLQDLIWHRHECLFVKAPPDGLPRDSAAPRDDRTRPLPFDDDIAF